VFYQKTKYREKKKTPPPPPPQSILGPHCADVLFTVYKGAAIYGICSVGYAILQIYTFSNFDVMYNIVIQLQALVKGT